MATNFIVMNDTDIIPTKYPPHAGYYMHVDDDAQLKLVQVTESPSSGRSCKTLKMGGSAQCGWQSWSGMWTPISKEAAFKQVKDYFETTFGIDKYGYGINETGIVVYHYDTINTDPFPQLDCDITVEHRHMGKVSAA